MTVDECADCSYGAATVLSFGQDKAQLSNSWGTDAFYNLLTSINTHLCHEAQEKFDQNLLKPLLETDGISLKDFSVP